MDINTFQTISAALLKKHYGLDLNDTELWNESVVAEYIEQGYRPYQIVAEHAEKYELERIDLFGYYGIPSSAITADDEAAVR